MVGTLFLVLELRASRGYPSFVTAQISLMQRTPAVPHSPCETGEYRWIRALPYSPFHVESRSWLYWSSRHWPSAIRMPRMVVTSAQSVESREIPVQSTAIGRKLNPATVGQASLRVARCSNRLHMPFRRHRRSPEPRISQAGGVRSLPGRAWLPADDRTVGGSRSDRRRPAPRRQRARQAGTAELLPRAIKLNPFTSFLYWRMDWHA